jgi:hypothetical protein
MRLTAALIQIADTRFPIFRASAATKYGSFARWQEACFEKRQRTAGRLRDKRGVRKLKIAIVLKRERMVFS